MRVEDRSRGEFDSYQPVGINSLTLVERDAQAVTFVLLPGAGGMAWYWHRVASVLRAARHEVIAVDLPADDERLGPSQYADIVIRAIGERSDIVLVAHSLGGFTAPLVCERVSVRVLTFVNAMIPLPGETAGEWWGNTGAEEARRAASMSAGYSAEFDLRTYFLHDVPAEVLRGGPAEPHRQAGRVFTQPCDFQRWPRVPIHVVASAGDRFFPLEFQKRVARERLGLNAEVVEGGHLVAVSNPHQLSALLLHIAGPP
jgi:pimeloyl-ACP methyl ester carboxylesterase